MRISIIDHEGKSDFDYRRDQPWKSFFEELFERGHELVRFSESPDFVIFMNDSKKIRNFLRRKNPKVFLFLIIWESPSTKPSDFKESNLQDFDFIFSPSPYWIGSFSGTLFNWPQSIKLNWNGNFDEWAKRKKEIAVFASNKYSFVASELYSTRRRLIAELGVRIDVYGRFWNPSFQTLMGLMRAIRSFLTNPYLKGFSFKQHALVSPICYKGIAATKMPLLDYRACLVVENDTGYVSEKLFDAISYGCLPLYVGPDLDDFGLSNDLVIRINSLNKVSKLLDHIEMYPESYYSKIESNIQFFESNNCKEFFNVNVLRKIANDICRQIDLRGGTNDQ